MFYQLPVECLNEIFEYLENDKITLHSCLLVNRLWCKIAVRILWRNVWNFHYSVSYKPYRTHVPLAIIRTLIACLPNESKDLLNKNKVFISTPTSKPPLFNYASFIKVLLISEFETMIQHVLHELKSQESIGSISLSVGYNKKLLEYEIIKMLMGQISCLKKLEYYQSNLLFAYFPGTRNCLTGLSELCCGTDVDSHFFYQLSQMCHNLQSLTVEVRRSISNGLADFISKQNNLKHLYLFTTLYRAKRRTVVPALTNVFNNLIKLKVGGRDVPTPTSIHTNLTKLTLSFSCAIYFEKLQDVIFPNLKVLKIRNTRPKDEILIKFFENNGRNLTELSMDSIDNSLRSSITQFCPNLKKISTILMNDLETLKVIFKSCQYLESIKVWHSDYFLERKALEIIANHSQKNFCELKIYHEISSNLLPEYLEYFLISWKNRVPKKSLILIDIKYEFFSNDKTLDANYEIMEIIEKYKKLGVIKEFRSKYNNFS